MAWHKFVYSTPAYGNEVHENFQICGSEDLLPLKISDTASYTTGVYNLGSVRYRWNRLYCNNLDINNSNYLNTKITVTPSGISTKVLYFNFSALSSYNFYNFLISVHYKFDVATITSYQIYFFFDNTVTGINTQLVGENLGSGFPNHNLYISGNLTGNHLCKIYSRKYPGNLITETSLYNNVTNEYLIIAMTCSAATTGTHFDFGQMIFFRSKI